MKKRFLVIIEKGPTSYGAYAPDVAGCGTSGDTIEEALTNIKEALELQLELMAETGESIPEATYVCTEFVDVNIPATAKAS